jgi:hypothetical protein
MTDAHQRRHLRPNPLLDPAMPRLAELAAEDLAVPLRTAVNALRAIEQWFVQHGDPFLPLDADQFLAQLRQHQFNAGSGRPVAELVARLLCDLAALKERVEAARGGG